jgi:predicted N-acyltransferase
MPGDREVAVVDTISAVDEDAWESLAGANVFATHGWLRTVERCSLRPVRPRYVLLRRGESLVGAAVCERELPADRAESLDSLMFGRFWRPLRAAGVSFLPALVCCPLDGYGAHFLYSRDASPDERLSIARELLRGLETEARREGLAVAFMEVLEDERELIRAAGESGYHHTRYLPLCRLDVRWSTFDEYVSELSHASKNVRKDIQRERNRNLAAGVTIERIRAIGDAGSHLFELMDATCNRHGDMGFPFNPGFFENALVNLGESAAIYTATKAGKITGVSVMLQHDGVAWGDYVGFDYEAAGRDFTYFNLLFHRPIIDAIDRGLKRLYYGRGQYRLKQRRGCTLCDSSVFYKPRRRILSLPVAAWCALHSKYFLRKRLR